MRAGEGDLVAGWNNKAMVAASVMVSSERLATQHRKKAEPGSGRSCVQGTAARWFPLPLNEVRKPPAREAGGDDFRFC